MESPEQLFNKFAPYDSEGNEYSPKEISNRIADWSLYFFSERHTRTGEVPILHREIYEDLASDYKYMVITAPSEFGKTTCNTLFYPLYRNVYYHEPYTVICTRTDSSAQELLDEIKFELRENEEFKRVYGALLPLPDERGKERYKKKDSAHLIELTFADGTTTAIRSIQIGGQIRGRKRGGYRVTLLIIDDPEEVQDMNSQTILANNLQWIDRSAIPRTDKEYGKIRVIGTRIGYNCTVDKLLKRNKWVKREYRALMPDDVPIEKRKSVWEKRWPTSFLLNERDEYISEGRLADWMWERMNEPPVYLQKTLRGYKFYRGKFQRHNEQNLLFLEGYIDPIPIYTYHAIDPAFSQADNADERAQVTFGMGYLPMDTWKKPCIFVLEYDFDHKDPDDIVERALDLHKKYYYREMIIETVSGQKMFEYIAVKEMAGDPFLLNNPITPRFLNYQYASKDDRIYQYFKNVTRLDQLFILPEMPELQLELDNFLNAPHLHLLDALEMGCRHAIPCKEEVNIVNPKKDYRKTQAEQEDWRLW